MIEIDADEELTVVSVEIGQSLKTRSVTTALVGFGVPAEATIGASASSRAVAPKRFVATFRFMVVTSFVAVLSNKECRP